MEHETKTPKYLTSDKTSFAYISARDRWPVIITGAIDDVHRAVSNAKDEAKIVEGKRIVEALAKLKYEMQHDRALTPLEDDGNADIEGYNQELEQLGKVTWFSVPWLYAECYLYRRMNTSFTLSQHWKSYDIFARQKISTFRSSRPAVIELALRFRDIVTSLTDKSKPTSPEAEKLLFLEMCEICLWGNATDLSLLTSLTYEDIQKLQGSEARKAAEKNILANDLERAYESLNAKPKGRVDIVLDNAGFELYVDLILAAYLVFAGLAESIVLHPKSIPWFVSDVLVNDFGALLSALGDPESFYAASDENGRKGDDLKTVEKEALSFLFEKLCHLHSEGQLILRPHRFWTEGGSFWRLPTSAPSLLEDLQSSELVIFKGDLNYRKLTGDAAWPATTGFQEALGPLGKGSGVNVLALRTCKADVVVGLEEGIDEKLRVGQKSGEESGAREWAWSGKWAVCSLSLGKE